MKIIYIANARIPTEKAHGIHIMKMCESFALYNANDTNLYPNATNKSKIEVELIIPRRFNWIKKDPFEYYGVEKSFKIKKLPCLDLIPLDKYIGHLGFWVESFTFFLFLLPYIFFKKADIIYTRDKFSLPLVLFKKNFVFEAHTFSKNYFLYSPFFKKVKNLIVITQKLKDLFINKGIPENRILVAPDGVDIGMFDIQCSKFEAREKLRLPLDKKIVLYTGHLYSWKGADILARASEHLPKDIDIYFVGGTEEDVRRYKIQDTKYKIQIIGHRPYAEIPYWLRAADVLVLPNSGKEEISKYWTSPLKMFEYMAAKKPIVASDLPSIREILNEENAVLVEPDSPQSLSAGILETLRNPKFSDKISSRAFEDVKQYSWEKRAKKICQKLF